MKIYWSPLALDRLDEVIDFVAENSPVEAEKLAEEIFDAGDNLTKFPQMGRIVPELQSDKFREIIIKNHRVVYRPEKKKVFVLTVRYTRQLLKADEIK